jgi:hypothetical protein
MKRIVKQLGGGLAICALSSLMVWGQATAQISGSVKDQSGAVLPGVEITATQTETGITRNTITNETGSYVLPNLAVGPYRLEVALAGFRTYVQTGIVLQVNSNPVINAVLDVGQVTEQVEVQANASLVETRSVGVGSVIENERILELPLNGRQVTDLIVLSGAAVQTTVNVPDRNMPQVVAMSVAGGLSTGTVYLLDGAMHNDVYSNYNLPLPFPDALQEFKVETSALSAQNGMYSGASVTSVTKSGTNDFHGSLFEFVRNDLFNARNFFATRHSTLKRNQFGGTIGGPIVRNRLFFFGGYQGTTVRQDAADNRAFVPTEAMLAGDFTAITSAQCRTGGQPLTLRSPFVDNRIDPARFSRPAVNIATKLPKTNDPCGLITYGIRQPNDESQIVGKIDYQRNDRHSVFGRAVITLFDQPVPYSLEENLLNTTVLGFDKRAQSYAFGDTYLLGPSTVNSFRLAVNRTTIMRSPGKFFSPAAIGVQNWFVYDPTSMTMAVTGAFSLGAPYGPIRNTSYQAGEDLSLIKGNHQLALGGSLAHWRSNLNALTNPSLGGFSFNGGSTGLPLADFLMGNMNQFAQRSPSETYMSQWYLGAYLADTWRAAPRFTVSYGLRWEPYIPQVVRNGKMANFSEERYKAGIKTTVFKNAPAGFLYPGDPDFPGTDCRPDGGLCNATGIHSRWGEITPRLGFAWDVRGDGRTSIRAAYGMGHEMLSGGFYNNFITPPWAANVLVLSPPGGFENPWLGFPEGNPFPPKKVNPDSQFAPFSTYVAAPFDAPPTTRHSWNLSIQRQVTADWLMSASYMGSQTHHLWGAQELNPAEYIGGNCQAGQFGLTAAGPCSNANNANNRRRMPLRYPNVGGTPMAFVSQYQPGGTQSYHGLLVSLQRRAARGLNIGGNYTWSHCYGDDSRASQAGTAGSTYIDPDNRGFDRGNCEGERRHIFNMTAVAETPQFANPTLRLIGTGWRLSGIYRKSTGVPLTILSGQNRSLTGVADQRAQQVLENPYGDKSITNYLNPAAFTQPALGTYGNMSPRSLAGPGTWQFDAALSRTFRIREAQRLEARVEAYNVTNSFRPGCAAACPTGVTSGVVTNISASNFGRIENALDPRILQFALKFVF